ncbi:MAG: GlxA family transcriptional regulator [Rhizobiaceae bacterium]
MDAPADNLDPLHVGVILVPDFSLMSFSSLTEPLRGANRMDRDEPYRWTNLSVDGGVIQSSTGLAVPTQPLDDRAEFDIVVVCGGHSDETFGDRRLSEYLRRMDRRRIRLGSVSTGSFVLADAGLLDGRRCTTHWGYIDTLRASCSRAEVCDEIYVVDGRVFTCAGGLAAMDAMLDIIRERHGNEFSSMVAENFIYGSDRSPDDHQRVALRHRLGIAHPILISAVSLMEEFIEPPLRLPEIASRSGVSPRQLERLFKRHLGCSPAQHYVRLRHDKARRLLRRTSMSVLEIAIRCGFNSASHFSRSYRQRFDILPSADRGRETTRR